MRLRHHPTAFRSRSHSGRLRRPDGSLPRPPGVCGDSR